MLNDSSNSVRVCLLNSINKLNEVLVIDLNLIKGNVIPAIVEIWKHDNWKIKVELLESIKVLTKIMSKENFIDKIFPIILDALTDKIFVVREVGIKTIAAVYEQISCEAFEKRLMDKLDEMIGNSNYLIRNTTLLLIKV